MGDVAEGEEAAGAVFAAIEATVTALGVCLGTRWRGRRGVALGVRSRSTRDGYLPLASEHVRRYLLYEVLGVKVAALAWSAGVHRQTVYQSIRRGRSLCRSNAKALGYPPPFERQPRPDDDD
jgi:hypothetical protein